MQNLPSVCLFLEDASPREVCRQNWSMQSQSSFCPFAVPLSFAASPEEETVVPSLPFLQTHFYFYQKLN